LLSSAWRWPALLALLAAASTGVAWLATAPSPSRPLQVLLVSSPPPTPAGRVAQIAGAVQRPGVYPVAPGARLADLLATAGGATGNADLTRLNLARHVADGERIDIPERVASTSIGLIRLNRATHTQLLSLPGMTDQAARAIEESIRTAGAVSSAEELNSRHVISAPLLDTIAPLVDWAP
jgi:DNA uptake protein ComE-like DNA-binding protein